jgi:hypothetical protein
MLTSPATILRKAAIIVLRSFSISASAKLLKRMPPESTKTGVKGQFIQPCRQVARLRYKP